MALTQFQLQILQILGPTMRRHGFALGGGAALIAHRAVNRVTTDLDHYSPTEDPATYQNLQEDMVAELDRHGFASREES